MDYPSAWIRGQLLDVKRFSDGTFKAYRLGEDELVNGKEPPHVSFNSGHDAQAFVSWWYERTEARH